SARRELGREWTQHRLTTELQNAGLSISRGWVANLETDRVRKLSNEEASALAKVLRKPADYFSTETIPVLRTDTNDQHTATTSYFSPGLNVVAVPIVGRVAASGIDYAPDEPPRGTTPFPLYGPPRGRLEALQVAGDSQEPTAPDGSFVILKSRDN